MRRTIAPLLASICCVSVEYEHLSLWGSIAVRVSTQAGMITKTLCQ